MKFHPFAEVFPLLDGAPLDELITDIKTFGLREKIWLYEGKVLDGRNRYLACQKAKIKPQYREFKGTSGGALALVVSANLQRRQLTFEQRAMALARISALNQQGGDRRSEDFKTARAVLKSDEELADQAGISSDSVQRARKIVDQGSKPLQAAVERGEIPLKKAASVVDLPKSEQLAAAKAKPEKKEESTEEDWEPQIGEDERLAAIEREQAATLDKLLSADDRLGHALEELKRKDAEIAVLKLSRDGYQNQCGELVRRLRRLQSKLDRLEKKAA